MKELILVRHGDPGHRARGMTGGWTNLPLADEGRRQARRAGERLHRLLDGVPFHFYASDLLQASETALIIAEHVGVEPVFLPALRDLDNGMAAGRSLEEAKTMEIPFSEPAVDWKPYPGAESWRMMHERLGACLLELHEHGGETVLAVSHGNAIVSLVHRWLNLPGGLAGRISFGADYGSITMLSSGPGGERTIVRLNDISHLP